MSHPTLRFPNPYILQTDLVEQTGVRHVDEFLFSLVNILQIGLGEYLRTILIIGSYAHGGYAPDSDIDICLIWKANSKPHDWRRGTSLWQHFARGKGYQLDPMWNFPETPLYDPRASEFVFSGGPKQAKVPCGPLLRLAMKEHGLLLWGEDIRPNITFPETKNAMLGDVLAAPVNWIKRAHYDLLDVQIEPPLTDPAQGTEDRGYGDLKHVAIFVLHLARALVFLKTDEFLFDKRDVPDAFERHCGQPWAAIVRDIDRARYGSLSEPEREAIHLHACRSLTDLQNHFLEALEGQNIDIGAIPI